MNKTVQQLTESTIQELLSCKTKKDCEKAWETAIQAIMSHKAPNGGSIADNTIRRVVSDIRTGIQQNAKPTKRHQKIVYWLTKEPRKSLNSDKQVSLGIVSVGTEIALRNNAKKRENRDKKAQLDNKKTLEGIEGLIKECEAMLNSWDWKDLAVAISLLTGRRTIEVMKTAAFKSPKANLVTFHGQAKAKGKKPYRIPVLSSGAKIAKATKRLRQLKDFSAVDNKKVNQAVHVALDRRTSKLLKHYTVNDCSMHDLRKIYAVYCYDKLSNSNIIKNEFGQALTEETTFIREILGHETTETGLHYRQWIVK